MADPDVLLAVLGIASVAAMGRLTAKTWMSPEAFFSLVWLFATVASLAAPLIGVERYRVWSASLWWIAAMSFMVFVGALVGRALEGRHRPLPQVSGADFKHIGVLTALCAAGGVIWPVFVSPEVYSGAQPPLYLQVFLGLHYMGPFFGGILFALSSSRTTRALALATLLPGFFFGLVDTGRTKVLIQLTFWFAAYFAGLLYVDRRPVALFTKGRTLAAAACVALLIAVGVMFTQFRSIPWGTPVGERFQAYVTMFDGERVTDSWEWMHSSIFGQVAGFSWYFEQAWRNPPTPKWGEQTATGLYRLLVGTPGPAIYTEAVGGISTNVFTIFKTPIEDYGLWGAFAPFLLLGIIGGWADQRVRHGELWPAALLMVFYTNAMNLGGWFLNYNSGTGSYVAVGLYLAWVQHRVTRAHRLKELALRRGGGTRQRVSTRRHIQSPSPIPMPSNNR